MICWSKVIKKGVHDQPNWLINGFREAVRDCELIDLPLEGYPYTWSKRMGTVHAVEERLDRALATNAWLHLFPQAKLSNLRPSSSDHTPILL